MSTKKQPKVVKKETLIYIGRSIPGLPQYTIFKGGVLYEPVKTMVEMNKHLAPLIVPVSTVQEARKAMRTEGHILNFHAKHLLVKE